MRWLIEPLHYSFMQTALVAAVLVGLTCAVTGAFVVLRRMAFVGDAVAHAVLPGLVLAYANGWSLAAGALGAGLATAFGIGWASRRDGVREDSAIGIIYTGMFALGVVMMNRAQMYRHLTHLLFGDILGVSPSDLVTLAVVSALVCGAAWLTWKELELTSFDPRHAQVMGLRPDRMRHLLLALVALTIVTGIQAVGVVLTSALLITPAATAVLVTKRLGRLVVVAAIISIGSSVAGLYGSYYWRVSSGAAIVLCCTGCFVVTWLVTAWRRRAARKVRAF